MKKKKKTNSDSEDSKVLRDFSTLARDSANHLLILSDFLHTKKINFTSRHTTHKWSQA